jgi:hypothetical protein
MASIDGVIVLACHEVWWCLEIWHGRSIVLSEEINQQYPASSADCWATAEVEQVSKCKGTAEKWSEKQQ